MHMKTYFTKIVLYLTANTTCLVYHNKYYLPVLQKTWHYKLQCAICAPLSKIKITKGVSKGAQW